MQALAILLSAVAAAAATSFAITHTQAAQRESAPAATDPEVVALRSEIDRLRQQLADLQQAPLPQSGSTGIDTRMAVPVLTDEQIGAAVQHYLQQHGGTALAEAVAAAEAAPLDTAQSFRELQSDASFWNNPELYKRLFAAGRMDELVALFEQRAKANPNDPQAQMDLGNVYLAHLQLDQTKWALSMKADQAFDRVLDIDENHWEARFTKALSYTFWPDFLGKKKEALAHFERLVAQQDTMPPQAHHAQTYLFLGNILDQRGDTARAREIWERGLRRHPGNQDLRQRLGN